MSHRKINNVGYKKYYPMSTNEDSTFCHYCGQEAGINVQLTWDHVPALNVMIPRELQGIRKVLIRACSECNGLASDTPHLDYLERHFWLKSKLLSRYKKLLISFDGVMICTEELDEYLSAVVFNHSITYESVLKRIGFGIKDIDDVDSPVLSLANKEGKRIKDILQEYLYSSPKASSDDEEDNDELYDNISRINIADEFVEDSFPYPYQEFISSEWKKWQVNILMMMQHFLLGVTHIQTELCLSYYLKYHHLNIMESHGQL